MTPTDCDNGDNGRDVCRCDDPDPGPEESPRECPDCGGFILGAIIDNEVHPGYTSLGNGQVFYDAKERWSLNSGNDGGINSHDEGEWFRSFASADVVPPHDHWKARKLGVEAVSFDHVVHADGSVELIVANRRLEDLPDGPKFPVQTGDIPDPRE